MKYRDPVTGEFKEISVKASDTLPIGTIVEYDGDTVPDGYELVKDYSTEEQVVGTWIDGKPLYRKTIVYTNSETIGATGNKKNILISHSISNLKQIESIKLTNNSNQIFPRADGTSSVTSWTGITNINSTDITLTIINDTWSSRTWYITLEYTKTTD